MQKRYIETTGWIDYKNMPLNEDGYRSCRYCGMSITCKRRKTFCSAVCVDEYLLRSNNRYLRKKVFSRDKGVCSLCNIDTKQIALEILCHDVGSDERNNILKKYDISQKRKIKKRMGVWDADHIISVKNGGGQCGLDNLRTLCIKCHKNITFSRK
jgi:5-methylcytosine-specific restriction protein A